MIRGKTNIFILLVFDDNANVYRAKFIGIFWIRLRFKRNALSFLKLSVSFGYDRRKMHENVITACVICYKPIALFRIKPLYCSLAHFAPP